ncbi:hypothetical protein [Lentzea cavernae]|uniref:hypothetical protein n=1 Tax=Lentzea cavernae TaxID=2020703 RepID=UPI001E5CC840|nr:hypothetical protein [Lentzea cavernae]
MERLRSSGDIIWENRRYESLYVIDRPSLESDLSRHFPVVHAGQLEAIKAIVDSVDADWLIVYLWCSRRVAERRIIERGTGDVEARLQAWDETAPMVDADLSIDTAVMQPSEAAALIDRAARSM